MVDQFLDAHDRTPKQIIQRVIGQIRKRWPKAHILAR
jgi:hypothetical protein